MIVADNLNHLGQEDKLIWDSGIINAARSINIPYKGDSLEPGKRYFWKIKIWDHNGMESPWSQTSWWHTGLLSRKEWDGARWIAYEQMDSSLELVPGVHGSGDNLGEKAQKRPVVPMFRKSFNINRKLASATLSVSGL